MALMLEAVDVAGPWRWRWLLTKEHSRRALADQRVQLDPDSAEVAAFADLYGHARWNAAPDRRMADEALAVHRAGEWAGRALLGEQVGAKIVAAARSGVTVRVSVPPPLEHVLGWPLELAHVAGRPLAARGDVSLVYDIGAATDDAKDPVTGTLRVLGLFLSRPTPAWSRCGEPGTRWPG